jgi:hypothetical protein
MFVFGSSKDHEDEVSSKVTTFCDSYRGDPFWL